MTEVRDDRTPLKSGDELELIFRAGKEQIYTQKAVVEEEIGCGASCITYIVRLFTEEKIGVRMIMKEFYPAPGKETFEAKREGTRLCFAKETISGRTFRHMRDNFRKSYRLQTELSGGASMEIMVRPYNMAEYGDSYYILSDIHLGTILSKTPLCLRDGRARPRAETRPALPAPPPRRSSRWRAPAAPKRPRFYRNSAAYSWRRG